MNIDADGILFRELNERVYAAQRGGAQCITLDNVRGQPHIGAGLSDGLTITINGVPGNDLAAFMNGAHILVSGSAQDGTGNTMNAGKVIVRGDAGDILGYSMRGGKIFVRGSVGYRAGIHMKAYRDRVPVVVVGGRAQDYLGEYMAGGVLAVLDLPPDDGAPAGRPSADNAGPPPPVGDYVGTGMHGGVIFVRGEVAPFQIGAEVGLRELDDADWSALSAVLAEFYEDMALADPGLTQDQFTKLIPQTSRPYGTLYAY